MLTSTGPNSILIVEDEGVIALRLESSLSEMGYHVSDVVSSGEAAVEAALHTRPDLILMDIRLEGKMDGVQAMREIHRCLDVPVVLLTAYSDPDTLRRAKEGEPHGYLVKPFTELNLHVAIDMALYRYELELRLRESEKRYRRRTDELEALNAVITRLADRRQGRLDLRGALETIVQLTGMDAGLIWLSDYQDSCLADEIEVVVPETAANLLDQAVFMQACQEVFRSGQTASSIADEQHEYQIAPIWYTEALLGIIGLSGGFTVQSSAAQLPLLETFGKQIGIAVAGARHAKEAADLALLKELDQLRSELIANVSHELRTPLGLIKIFATTLLRDDLSLDITTQREMLEDIGSETDKLEVIVSNLLDLSRLENRRLTLNLAETDLAALARLTVRSMEKQLEGGQTLRCELRNTPLFALVDPERIEQVLRNLISNAIKYSPDGGEIVVTVRKDTDRAIIEVVDPGIGISHTDQAQIFERFYRVESEQVRGVRGAGLGLAVCRAILAAHRGSISVESVLGNGSLFRCILPIQPHSGDFYGELV